MSCDPCKHGNNPYDCSECRAEFVEHEKQLRGPHGPKGATIIDRRASQQPDKPKPERREQSVQGILTATMAGIAMTHLGDSSGYDPEKARAIKEHYDREMQPYRRNRKRKNKAARKSRRANRIQ